MGLGGLIEPLVVVTLLFGGTWINRNKAYRLSRRRHSRNTTKTFADARCSSPDSLESGQSSPVTTDGLLSDSYSSDDSVQCSSPSLLTRQEARWRKREIGLLGRRREVMTPNTRVFRGRLLSRLLRRFPFLVEAWYWALIYWVCTSSPLPKLFLGLWHSQELTFCYFQLHTKPLHSNSPIPHSKSTSQVQLLNKS